MASASASTRDAVASALRVLLGVSGARSVGLWAGGQSDPGHPELIAIAGDAAEELPDLRAAAIAALAGRPVDDPALTLVTVEPERTRGAAVLIGHDPHRPPGAHAALLRAARPALASLLGARSTAPVDHTTSAAVRRLDRLRYDLHDGPLQDVHLLAQDLRLFRQQLEPIVAGHPDRDRALGRLDDLEAQLIGLDEELRGLLTPAGSGPAGEAPPAGRRRVSVAQSLMLVAEAFSERTGIVPRTEVSGDVESLTESQQIALVSLVREALANVRQHSDAEAVAITLLGDDEAITVEIRDDGSGFAVEETGRRAAQGGHLGLVGMRERMRMLGGETRIDSAPGGPTVVSATLPRWPMKPGAA